MRIRIKGIATAGALAALVLFSATPAAAYIGPGLPVGVLAAVFGAIAAFFMMLAGLIWYPLKVMLRKRREKKAGGAAGPSTGRESASAAAEETSQ